MSEDSSPLTLGDMVVGLVAELQERVQLEGDARRVVVMAIALAANNGRLFGVEEVLAQAAEQGVAVDVAADAIEAPATLAQALGAG